MKASFSHLQINVRSAADSFPFYKDLLAFLGWEVVDESDEHLGATDGTVSLWIIETDKDTAFNRTESGLNHIAFSVESADDIDSFKKDFLDQFGIPTLYETPKLFPEYGDGYYAVYFEGPERLKIELLFTPR